MPRLLLSDEHWSKLEPILLQHAIYRKRDLRMTVEGMLYRMRIACPWRDLPRAFGSWSKVYKRFNAWCATGKWLNDLEWVFIDGRYAKAHQHSSGCLFSLSNGPTGKPSSATRAMTAKPSAIRLSSRGPKR